MPETSGSNGSSDGADVMQMWRSWLSETERQWNGFFNQMMGTDAFSRFAGSYVDAYSVVQRTLNLGMERYLNTFNLPTHSDIIELGERLHNIEERLTSLEANIQTLAQAAGVNAQASVTQLRPRRTRRPRTETKAKPGTNGGSQ